MQKAKKDYLIKLSVREIRLEAKKLSIHLYSRKNKEDLVKLILKDREKVLIEDKTRYDIISFENAKAEEERKTFEIAKAEEERIAFENVKAEEERKTFEIAKAEEERIAFENVKAEEERITFENAKAEEERIAFEKAKAEEELNINSDKHSNLKRVLSESFPKKTIIVNDNNDGSQTIFIH